MAMHRRKVLKGLGAAAASLAVVKAPYVHAQTGPIRVGFLTVKTGPLASGGLQMEQGLLTFLKDRKNMLGNRPVELTTADTTGNPAVCRTKMQELVERFNVSCVLGPLAAFEALAIDDYIRSSRTPTLSVAGAEDLTQRKPNPYFSRPGSTSAQCGHVMADYALKDLKYKRVATIADDFAYGHENVAGFQRAFEDAGGKVVQKLWTPLNAPDYGTYISQLKPNLDGLYTGHAGSNGLKLIRQLAEYGLKGKLQIVGGFTPIDESLLQRSDRDILNGEVLLHRSDCGHSGTFGQDHEDGLHPQRGEAQVRSGDTEGREQVVRFPTLGRQAAVRNLVGDVANGTVVGVALVPDKAVGVDDALDVM